MCRHPPLLHHQIGKLSGSRSEQGVYILQMQSAVIYFQLLHINRDTATREIADIFRPTVHPFHLDRIFNAGCGVCCCRARRAERGLILIHCSPLFLSTPTSSVDSPSFIPPLFSPPPASSPILFLSPPHPRQFHIICPLRSFLFISSELLRRPAVSPSSSSLLLFFQNSLHPVCL